MRKYSVVFCWCVAGADLAQLSGGREHLEKDPNRLIVDEAALQRRTYRRSTTARVSFES